MDHQYAENIDTYNEDCKSHKLSNDKQIKISCGSIKKHKNFHSLCKCETETESECERTQSCEDRCIISVCEQESKRKHSCEDRCTTSDCEQESKRKHSC